jgi:hypothetical protein
MTLKRYFWPADTLKMAGGVLMTVPFLDEF